MNKFAIIFLAVCVVLAILLLTGVLTVIAGSVLFAVSLLVLGLASRGVGRSRK